MIRKRNGYWQVKVYAGLDPLTGEQRFEYDRAKTKREAGRVEAAVKTKVAEGRSLIPALVATQGGTDGQRGTHPGLLPGGPVVGE